MPAGLGNNASRCVFLQRKLLCAVHRRCLLKREGAGCLGRGCQGDDHAPSFCTGSCQRLPVAAAGCGQTEEDWSKMLAGTCLLVVCRVPAHFQCLAVGWGVGGGGVCHFKDFARL